MFQKLTAKIKRIISNIKYNRMQKKEKERERHWLMKPDLLEEDLCETRLLTPDEVDEIEEELQNEQNL